MRLEYLPTEGETDWFMYAYYNEQNNQVIWNATNLLHDDNILGTDLSQFLVWRRGKVVVVEACGWYGPCFHFKLEITELPDRVVILAHEAAALMDRAHDEDSPARG